MGPPTAGAMMNKESLARIIQLVELDQRITRLDKDLTEKTLEQARLTKERNEIDDEVAAAEKVVHTTKKNIDSLELDMKSIQVQLERTSKKLLSANTAKELSSLQNEKKSLEKQLSHLDEEGFAVLNDLENAQKKVALLIEQKPEKLTIKQQALKEIAERENQNARLRETLVHERNLIVPQVDEEFMQHYETMRKRVSNPVVPILKDSCSGCFYGLSRPALTKAQQGALLTCQACYRILYLTDAIKNRDEHSEQ